MLFEITNLCANNIKQIRNTRTFIPFIDLKAIVQYTGIPLHEDVISWRAFMKIGEEATDLDKDVDQRLACVGINKCCHLVYTSGTTGLPKAAIIKHSRFILASIMCKYVMGLRENDVLYTAGLPLYHTLGRSISPLKVLGFVRINI